MHYVVADVVVAVDAAGAVAAGRGQTRLMTQSSPDMTPGQHEDITHYTLHSTSHHTCNRCLVTFEHYQSWLQSTYQ